ncbi:MAG: MopE-related protein [Bradymonadia bacterium]
MFTRVKRSLSVLCVGALITGCASSDDEGIAPSPDARVPVQDRGLPPPPLADAMPVMPDAEALDTEMPDAALPDMEIPTGCADGETRPCYEGPEGTEGVGACAAGVETCADGEWGRCEGQVRPAQVDACDGTDEDCNGLVDDSPGVGAACSLGQGACAAEGARACDPETGGLRCDAGEPGEPAAETCNDIDDDCDGTADEGFGLGAPCMRGVGACAREGEVVCGPDGLPVCGVDVGNEAEELCNGLDDDCDGTIDEEPDDVGEACDVPGAQGLCVTGETTCSEGNLICEGAAAIAEDCNGLDDDCDGRVDEGVGGGALTGDCYDGPEGTLWVGACQGGTRTCNGGVWGQCNGQQLPADEVCNRIDDDCDGVVDVLPNDEACACQPGEERACYSGPQGTAGWGQCRLGVQQCQGDGRGFGPCEGEVTPDEETCGNGDEDCDGNIDEVAGVGEPCEDGVGACRQEGTQICGPGGALVCSAEANSAMGETCNNIDDDCDGLTDEDTLDAGAACTVGEGVCAAEGAFICVEGGLLCTAVPGEPGEETCQDGLDGDCDGQVDEGCPDEPGPDPEPGPVCEDPTILPGTVGLHVAAGTNTEATDDHRGSCSRQVGGRDQIFEFSLDRLRTVRLQTRPQVQDQYDTVMYLRSDCADTETEIACNDDGGEGLLSLVQETLEPGSYTVVVDGYRETSTGAFTLQLEVDPHDTCDGAIELGPLGANPIEVAGDTVGASNEGGGSCGLGSTSPDHVYTFTVANAGQVVIEALATAGQYDTVMHLRSDCGDAATQVICNDDGGAGTLSRIDTNLEAGRYYLFIDGYSNNRSGAYRLSFSAP